ncbi:hypothetical protein HD597_003001 [Nonomuraea thailandensis]|uniref:Uncharacterized protein n=1 Tax=Nonomuraea thailandensis TaxID=1188745 RepID=A0A9X2GIF5_9ACTN|nr:hypothetical protein [Nonomuraea thailandensis]MCP2355981.1 hypothetical protein [Nonomuraea thailandensis]
MRRRGGGGVGVPYGEAVERLGRTGVRVTHARKLGVASRRQLRTALPQGPGGTA